MEDKEVAIKRLTEQRESYRRRNKVLFLLWICQFLIWWIVNPEFIPVLKDYVKKVQDFLIGLLWPHDAEELLTGSYRVYIYQLCQWVQQLPVYDLLALVAPGILPVWLLVNLIMIGVKTRQIKNVNKPPKPKKKIEWRLPTIVLPTGKKICGLYPKVSAVRNADLEKLKKSCTELQRDHVLWIGNRAKGHAGRAPLDELHLLKPNEVVRISSGDGEYQIWLEKTQSGGYEAVIRVCGQDPFPLTEGVPLVVTRRNEAGNEIREMTITWIGGSV